ncbi:peripheral-type benzodiazepine receptor-associated protein 1-like, partial [Tachysurus ichikawai]
ESELQNVLQRKTHLNVHSLTDIQKTTECEQVSGLGLFIPGLSGSSRPIRGLSASPSAAWE